jgi:hypothetical protein
MVAPLLPGKAIRTMPVEFSLSEDDYEQAVRLGSPLAKWRIAVLAVMALALAGFAIFGSSPVRLIAMGALISFTVVVTGSRLFLMGFLARRTYRNYKAIQEATRVELKAEGLAMETRDAQGLLRWEKVLKWRHNDQFLLIYQAPRLFHTLPKSIAAQGFDMDGLIQALETHVGPAF